jgi:CBS domain containing-hemolysin-like protein
LAAANGFLVAAECALVKVRARQRHLIEKTRVGA